MRCSQWYIYNILMFYDLVHRAECIISASIRTLGVSKFITSGSTDLANQIYEGRVKMKLYLRPSKPNEAHLAVLKPL